MRAVAGAGGRRLADKEKESATASRYD